MAASTKTGYDPSTMQWVDIEVAETREDPIPGEDEYLQIMVRQMQEKLAKMKPRGSTAAAQPQARKTGSTPAACVESPRQLATSKPTHTPRIRSDELVLVLKPKITLDLHAAFGPGGIGTAVQRFTGSTTNAGISVWPVWDQNIVVKLVLQLQHDVAPIVYVFKVLPRCFNPEDADAERNKKKARLLNRTLTATLKRWSWVRILNAEVSLRRHENAVPSWAADITPGSCGRGRVRKHTVSSTPTREVSTSSIVTPPATETTKRPLHRIGRPVGGGTLSKRLTVPCY
ncbi:hypothetical protein MRX96_023047 [Rhipicephalus microplus]